MYKAIIFDFFDVIRTDPLNRWLATIGRQKEGAILAAANKQDAGQLTRDEFFMALAAATGESAKDIEADFQRDIPINYPLLDLIGTLKEQYKIGLLSNAPFEFLRGLLRTHEAEELFHEITISSEVGMIKPQPEIFHHILRKLGAKPEEAVFIDDNPKNIAAAEALGIRGIVYTDFPALLEALATL